MTQAEKEFTKWFIDRFGKIPGDEDAILKEAFCNAYNLGVQHTGRGCSHFNDSPDECDSLP